MDILTILMVFNICWTGGTNLLVGVVAVVVAWGAWKGQKKLFRMMDEAIADVKREVTDPKTVKLIVTAVLEAIGPMLKENNHEVGEAIVNMGQATGDSIMARLDGKIGSVAKRLKAEGVQGGGGGPGAMDIVLNKKLTLPEKAMGLFFTLPGSEIPPVDPPPPTP